MSDRTGKEGEEINVQVPVKDQKRDLTEAGQVLESWLRQKLPHAKDLAVTDVQMPGGAGVANETLLVDTEQHVEGENVEVAYVVRVDSPTHLFKDMELHVHYQMYDVLSRHTDIPVPKVLAFEEDTSLLGQRFFLMERIYGRVPPDNPPFHEGGWVKEEMTAEQRRTMWRNMVEVMARVNAVDPELFPFLQRPHLGRSGLEQEFRHWLNYAKWCGGDENPIIDAGGRWLLDNFPADPPTELSWGDSRLPNVIFQGTDIVAILDWDMVSLAGGACDLAWYKTMDQPHTVCRGMPRLEGFGTPQETVDLWEEFSGRKAENLHWHAMFNAFRIANIMIRLPTMLRREGRLPPDLEYLFTNNSGHQWLAALLGLPPPGEVTIPWMDWDV